MMVAFNSFQYQDLQNRSADLYANTKYSVLLRWLSGLPPMDVLNAGCGSGDLCLLLAARGHRVTGIDPVPEYIDLARALAERDGVSNCSYAVSSIEDYRPDQSFDCVIATDVLEHIEDDRHAFDALADMVRPGGHIVITVPAGPWLFGHHDEVLGHYRRYTRRTLANLVRERCEVQKLRYFGFSLIPVCYLYSKVWRKDYPVAQAGDSKGNPLVAAVLSSMLRLDGLVPMPLGTSLLLMGKRR